MFYTFFAKIKVPSRYRRFYQNVKLIYRKNYETVEFYARSFWLCKCACSVHPAAHLSKNFGRDKTFVFMTALVLRVMCIVRIAGYLEMVVDDTSQCAVLCHLLKMDRKKIERRMNDRNNCDRAAKLHGMILPCLLFVAL